MLTPVSVIHPSSANDAEILVACVDENGKPANITIVDAVLGAQLTATAASVPNPDYPVPVASEAIVAEPPVLGEPVIEDDPAPPPTIPNPAYQPLIGQALAKAVDQIAADAERVANPDGV